MLLLSSPHCCFSDPRQPQQNMMWPWDPAPQIRICLASPDVAQHLQVVAITHAGCTHQTVSTDAELNCQSAASELGRNGWWKSQRTELYHSVGGNASSFHTVGGILEEDFTDFYSANSVYWSRGAVSMRKHLSNKGRCAKSGKMISSVWLPVDAKD